MTYGLSPGLFVENDPAIHAAGSNAARSSARFRAWRRLDAERRLKAVERALGAPGSNLIDDLPVAL